MICLFLIISESLSINCLPSMFPLDVKTVGPHELLDLPSVVVGDGSVPVRASVGVVSASIKGGSPSRERQIDEDLSSLLLFDTRSKRFRGGESIVMSSNFFNRQLEMFIKVLETLLVLVPSKAFISV